MFFTYNIKKKILLTSVILSSFILFGCGGGGGGSSASIEGELRTLAENLATAEVNNHASGSSQVGGETTVSPAFASDSSFSNSEINLSYNDGSEISDATLDSDDLTGTDLDSNGYKNYFLEQETDEGRLLLDMYTNIEAPGDTDWLAGGIWWYYPADGGVEIGNFVTGTNPFNTNSVTGTGTQAVYSGRAVATYYDSDDGWREVGGEVALTATFNAGGSAAADTIAGRIYNFQEVDKTPTGQLLLQQTAISEGGFEGDIGGSIGFGSRTYNFDGKYGGQFYRGDNYDAAVNNGAPNAVGGHFGGSATNSSDASDVNVFTGVFGAERQ